LFVVPGAIVIALLAVIYATLGDLSWVQAVFLGIKAAVVVIVIEALLKLSRRALLGPFHVLLAVIGFVAVFVYGLPFPLVVLGAAIIGAAFAKTPDEVQAQSLPTANSAKTLLLWSAIWLVPLVLIFWSDPEFLGPLAVFFSKLAVVTFGGAYAVLAYMTQTVVQDYGWVTTTQMIDALGLAETTPGPLILVTEFVAMLAGYGRDGIWLALTAGLVSLWMTFTPCFMWIFVGAPYIEWLSSKPRLSAALSAITASVVGVIASLSLWFALHVFFGTLNQGPIAIPMPELNSFQPIAALLACTAGYLLLWRHWAVLHVLAISAGAGLMTLGL